MKTETISFESNCPQCGAPLPKDAPMGMCPICLLAEGQSDQLSRESEGLFDSEKSVFGDYELLELIARGGMGVVYRARQKSLHRDVALKMILSGNLASDNEVNRFKAEAKAAAHLNHPNIVAVHEVGELDGQHFYSMEFIKGVHLGGQMNRKPLNVHQAVNYLIKITRAVAYAHQKGVVHRDLKPQNILVDEQNEPRITDFGLAKRMDAESELTLSGAVFGSPAYMAPEQAIGKQEAVGPLTDVYALGALLYYMLSGRPPFQASTPLETLKQVTESAPLPLRQIHPDIPADLETICFKCLEKEPGHRYHSADELVQELERWVSNLPILARPSTARERVQKWARRNPVLTSMSVLVMLVGLIAFVAVWWQLQQTRSALAKAEQLIVAEATARATEMEPYLTMAHEGPVVSVAFSKDGRHVLSGSHDQTARIWDARKGEVMTEFSGHRGVVGKVVYSPDEKYVLTLSFDTHFRYPHLSPMDALQVTSRIPRYGDQSVRVWNVETGSIVAVLQHSNQVVDAGFSPDGKKVVTASWDHHGRIWDVKTGKEIHTLSHHQAALLSAQFSTDGSQVVTTSSGNDYQITLHPGGGGGSTSSVHEKYMGSVWNVESGESVGLIDNLARDGFLMGGRRSSRSTAQFSPDGKWIIFAGGNPSNCLLWNVGEQRIEHVLEGHASELVGAQFNATGTKVISYGVDRTARIWDVASGKQIALLTAHKDTVLWAEFSSDDRLVVTASGDGTARVWDARTGVGITVLKGHLDKVYQARFSPDGLRVVTGSEDGTLRLWDAANMDKLSKVFKGHEGSVLSIDIRSDNKKVVTGSSDGTTRIWDLDAQTQHAVCRGYGEINDDQIQHQALGDVMDVRFGSDGNYVFTASDDSRAIMRPVDMSGKASGEDVLLAPFSPFRMWDAQTGQLVKRFEHLSTGVRSVRINVGGTHLLAIPNGEISDSIRLKGIIGRGWQGNRQKVVVPLEIPVWDMKSGQELFRLTGLIDPIHDVAFSQDGKWIATADKGPVRIWDATDGALIKEMTSIKEAWSIQFTEDSESLFVKDMRGANLWDLETAQRMVTYPSPGIPFIDATLYENLERVLGWTQENGMVCLFDMNSGKLIIQLNDVAKRLRKALLSQDGRLLVTIGWDKTPKVWDARTGELLESLEGHEDDVLDAVMSPDGRWLGTVSEDYTARLWPLNVIRTVR